MDQANDDRNGNEIIDELRKKHSLEMEEQGKIRERMQIHYEEQIQLWRDDYHALQLASSNREIKLMEDLSKRISSILSKFPRADDNNFRP
jgi:hypothetical protein